MSAGVHLAVWSGPRNISTALMRSWENRPDTNVVDEPLYGFYLDRTQLDHPGRDEIIADMGSDWRPVVADLTGPVDGVYYQKQMAQHLIPELPREWIGQLTNILLIRDPAEVVASYTRERSSVVATDIGLVTQAELYDQLGGPPVIESADFLRDPEGYLRWMCDHIGVDFTDAMLSWPAGLRDSDGIWAKYWYDAVHRSTGFTEYRPREVHLEGDALRAAKDSRPFYDRLHSVRVRV